MRRENIQLRESLTKYISQIENYSKEIKKMKDEKINFEKNNNHFESEKQSYLDEIEKLKGGKLLNFIFITIEIFGII